MEFRTSVVMRLFAVEWLESHQKSDCLKLIVGILSMFWVVVF